MARQRAAHHEHKRGWIQRLLAMVFLASLECAVGACRPGGISIADTSPSPDLSVEFHLEPIEQLTIGAGETATYRVIVDRKGLLNAGVEFEVRNVPAGFTVTIPAHISETARETQLVVQTSPTMRPGDYELELRARLTVAGRGAPNWHTPQFLGPRLRVTGGIPAFDLECSKSTFELRGGFPGSFDCSVRRDPGLTSSIDISISPKPAYLTISPESAVLEPGTDLILFRFERARFVPTPASIDLVVTARSGAVTRQHTVRVEMPPDLPLLGFEILCTGELALRAGEAKTLVCRTIRSEGFLDVINFSFAPHPAYLTIYDETASLGPDRQSVEFSVVRSLTALTPAFFDLEVIARAFPYTERATVRVHMPGS